MREVALLNLSAQGGIGEAISVAGIASFDGAGNYTFSGQLDRFRLQDGNQQRFL